MQEHKQRIQELREERRLLKKQKLPALAPRIEEIGKELKRLQRWVYRNRDRFGEPISICPFCGKKNGYLTWSYGERPKSLNRKDSRPVKFLVHAECVDQWQTAERLILLNRLKLGTFTPSTKKYHDLAERFFTTLRIRRYVDLLKDPVYLQFVD